MNGMETAAVKKFRDLAVRTEQELVFGQAAHPVACGFGLTIGAGTVFPEVNFTLPAVEISAANWPEVLAHYREIAKGVIRRAHALKTPGIVLEFELLPAMTETPEWGAEITALLHESLESAHQHLGLRSALRVTPTDIRDRAHRPLLREGPSWEKLQRSSALCAAAGADILSIESVGGKELHDYGLMYGDVRAIVCALGVLAPRDMAWLWDHISATAAAVPGTIAGGDTACGFANTAMQLAHQKMLPEVLAAVVRAMSAARSLVAMEHGAVGPSKDCAYEGPVLKAIAGCPISMEGKSAACAHFSPVGNVASAMCDLWSNESVQNIRLLAGNAPEVFTEVLAYDCRLMNAAKASGQPNTLRDWLVASDERLSPQALLLSPASTIRIADAIVSSPGDYRRTVAAGLEAVSILMDADANGRLDPLSKREKVWLGKLAAELECLPDEEGSLLEEMLAEHSDLVDPSSYGLGR